MDTIDKIKQIMELNKVMMNQSTMLFDAIAADDQVMVAQFTDSQAVMAQVIGNITDEPVAVVIDRYNTAVQEMKGRNS